MVGMGWEVRIGIYILYSASQVVLVVKTLPANAGGTREVGSIPGSRRSPEEGKATHSGILAWKIPMDRGTWRATVQRVAKTGLKRLSMRTYTVCKIGNCTAQGALLNAQW